MAQNVKMIIRPRQAHRVSDGDKDIQRVINTHASSTDFIDGKGSQLSQRLVIVQRDERGYGFSVSGDSPVFIQSVKDNGAAARAGVQCGDRIIKVNGTLVTSSNHENVVKMIKSGPYVALTLLGRSSATSVASSATVAPRHLAETSALPLTSTTSLTGNPVLDREKISTPKPVDQVKDQEFREQKMSTIRMMYKQAVDDYEKTKVEFQRNPTEQTQARLEMKLQMLRRVEDQLNDFPHSDSVQRSVHLSDDGEERRSRDDSPAGFPSAMLPPSGARHRRTESMPDKLVKMAAEARSQEKLSVTSIDDSRSKLDTDLEKSCEVSKELDDGSIPTAKPAWREDSVQSSVDATTDLSVSMSVSSPDMVVVAREAPEPVVTSQPSTATTLSPAVQSHQVNVISMEDDDFSADEERVDEPSVFNDISQLKNRPAHIAVFLHYLLSNCDPSSLLFYLVTETYPSGSVKEMRKWAYEIHSTFLCEKSPMRMLVDSSVVSAIESSLHYQHDREDVLKSLFSSARTVAQNEIADLLQDFRHKRSIGLGGIYGDHELRDNLDRHSELKIVDSALWKHFETLAQDEESDRSQAMASSLATFFRSVGYSGMKNNTLLERCPYFNAKDRKVFKFTKGSKKIHMIMSHQFLAQQYLYTTQCYCCQTIIWGIGNQGYQCANCDINVHKNCLDRIRDSCTASGTSPGGGSISGSGGGTMKKKREKSRQPSVFDKIISRKPSTNSPAAIKEAQIQHEQMNSPNTTSAVLFPGAGVHEDEEELEHRRTAISCESVSSSNVPRAISMPSVHDIGQAPKSSASTHSLAKHKANSREDVPIQTIPSRVGKLVARYSELGKTIASPLDEVMPVAADTPTSRGQSPVSTTGNAPDNAVESDRAVVTVGRSESLNQKGESRTSVRRAHSDVQADDNTLRPVVSSGSSSNSSLSVSGDSAASNSNEGLNERSSTSHPTPSSSVSFPHKSVHTRVLNDPDFDIELELPSLEAIIPKDQLRKLKPKEKKRQEVINELFYTEKAHVRVVKVLQRIFYQPMRDETWISSELVNLLFPNIDDLVELHSAINAAFLKKREENPVVGDFAEILVNKFSSLEGERFTKALSTFCRSQSHALEMLRIRQRKDQKFHNFIQEAASHPYCRRLELKDFIPMTMQRLTKYPLLIESLLKYTPSNTEEYDMLTRAHESSKNILNDVNRAVQECENHQRLVELQKRLDRRPIENSSNPAIVDFKKLDLTQYRMLYEGSLTWRISRSKQLELHAVLLEHILVLLQRQDDRLVLRCQSMTVVAGKDDTKFTHSPIIRLNNLLTRSVATDKRAFFLVSNSDVGAQIYELVANSKDEKNKWFKHITDAAEACKVKDGNRCRKQSAPSPGSNRHHDAADVTSPFDRNLNDDDDVPRKSTGSVESLDTVGQGVEVLHIETPNLVQPNEVVVSSTVCMEKLSAIQSPQELLMEKTEQIHRLLNDKKVLVADILQIPSAEYETISEMVEEVKDPTDARELLLGSVVQADTLTQLINERLSSEHVNRQRLATDTVDSTSPGPSHCDVGGFPVVVSAVQLLSISTRLHHNLSRLTEVLIRKLQETERLQAEVTRLHQRLDLATQGQADDDHAADEDPSHRCRPRSPPHSSVSITSSMSAGGATDVETPVADVFIEQPDRRTAATLTATPVMMEQLEMVEAISQPTVVDACEVVVLADPLSISEHFDNTS